MYFLARHGSHDNGTRERRPGFGVRKGGTSVWDCIIVGMEVFAVVSVSSRGGLRRPWRCETARDLSPRT
jgi:hypothetical protein